MEKIKILAISGSLRKLSFNTSALRAASEMLPENTEMEIFDLIDIPIFNQDLEKNLPEAVVKLKAAVRAADAILVSSPEYNYSYSGVIKNAFDWGTRPYGDNAFTGKPGAIMGASSGRLGTARGYYDLAKLMRAVNIHLLNFPEVMISESGQKFDSTGKLTDEDTAKKISNLVAALADWAAKLKSAGIAK